MQIKALLQLVTDTQAAMQKGEETITSLEKHLSNRYTTGSTSSQQPALVTPGSRISRAPDVCSDVITVDFPISTIINQGKTSQPVGLFCEDQDSAKSAESHVEAKRRRRETRKLELEAAILANQSNPTWKCVRHFAVLINSCLICRAFSLQLAFCFIYDQCCYSMPLVFNYHFWLYYRSCLKIWFLLIWATSSPSAQLDLRDGEGEKYNL